MNKIVLIVIFLVALISVAVFVMVPPSQPGNNGVVENPFSPIGRPATSTPDRPIVVDNQATLSIGTAASGTMSVKDFLSDADTFADTLNKEHYFLGNRFLDDAGVATTPAPTYIIEYYAQSQTFNVALLQEPIGQSREQAQQYLAKKLGISSQQLCALKYMVSVPGYVSDIYTSIDLRFSFCPNATAL